MPNQLGYHLQQYYFYENLILLIVIYIFNTILDTTLLLFTLYIDNLF